MKQIMKISKSVRETIIMRENLPIVAEHKIKHMQTETQIEVGLHRKILAYCYHFHIFLLTAKQKVKLIQKVNK